MVTAVYRGVSLVERMTEGQMSVVHWQSVALPAMSHPLLASAEEPVGRYPAANLILLLLAVLGPLLSPVPTCVWLSSCLACSVLGK